ncbi:MAG: glycosyltransferase family 2 protein [Bacteroidales bacterium]|nr:glycosyltransferase family 2 protein [Bacteroidales bacterium]
MLTTVFTPTYNRASYLKILFESLQKQTNKSFEWIIVDDGSTDETEKLVQEFKNMASFPLYYFKKENGGKQTAINYGMKHVNGELFFIVDSDDYLGTNAIQMINDYYPDIKDNDKMAGVTFLKHYHNGKSVGTQSNPNRLVANYHSYRTVYKVSGDRLEIVKTVIMKKFPFPEYSGERLCPEGLIWLRIAKEYDALFIANNEPIYYCEYLPDGYSLGKPVYCPNGVMDYMNEWTAMKNTPFVQKIKYFAFYWHQSIIGKIGFKKAYKRLIKKWGVVSYPLGLYLLLTRNRPNNV